MSCFVHTTDHFLIKTGKTGPTSVDHKLTDDIIDIHYHVVIYSRVVLLSLNNTVEFFK